MVVMGTRPEAIKLCPLIKELKKRRAIETLVCSTGQHRAMLDSALQAFSVKADFDLDSMRTGQTLSDLTGRMLRRIDEILAAEHPDLLLVQGDTTTAFAASLAAFHRHIPIGHVEAGLRTYHMNDPFPEEFHRQAISLVSDYHFAPTVAAKRNLLREGKHESRIFITGNTIVDALRITLSGAQPYEAWQIPQDKRILLFTAHRRESLGKPLVGMLRALRRIVEDTPDVIAYFPVHHNPEVRRAAIDILKGVPRIRMIEPPEIVSFHHLLSRAYLILTDSGGIQEEASALGIPTVVMRYSSERTEGMRAGVLKLAGSGEEGIYNLTRRLLAPGSAEYETMKKPSAVYGDGKSSLRIADIIERILN
jgi:UDP-N-acetylglucosamine 2-epimerase (non-hydrolysing)